MIQVDLHGLLDEKTGLPRTTTLFRENGLRMLLLHLKPGEQIPEHKTPGAITVHCLDGNGIFSTPNDRLELRPGLLIGVPPAAPHSVVANDDLLLLVAISERTTAA